MGLRKGPQVLESYTKALDFCLRFLKAKVINPNHKFKFSAMAVLSSGSHSLLTPHLCLSTSPLSPSFSLPPAPSLPPFQLQWRLADIMKRIIPYVLKLSSNYLQSEGGTGPGEVCVGLLGEVPPFLLMNHVKSRLGFIQKCCF